MSSLTFPISTSSRSFSASLGSLPSRQTWQRLYTTHTPLRPCLPATPSPSSTARAFHTTPRPRSQPSPRFTYHISAAYSDKRHPLNPTRNLFNFNPYVRLKRTTAVQQRARRDAKNRPQSGEDAFFISHVGDTGAVAFGVVDGVGGWQSSGVDPADFAHSLCEYMASAASGFPDGFKARGPPLRPQELLDVGYRRVIEDKSILAGGSTACIATAEPDGRFEVANLGDSGFVHLGQNAVRYNSAAQTHAFNTPFQLSKIPARMLQQALTFGGAKPYSELPADAAVSAHRLRHGDVLLLATDGVWDNLSPADALAVVSRTMRAHGGWEVDGGDGGDGAAQGAAVRGSRKLRALTSQRAGVGVGGGVGGGGGAGAPANTLQALLALAVAREAKEASLDRKRDGPFAREVQKHYPQENWHGGKADDICAVVVVAVEEGGGL